MTRLPLSISPLNPAEIRALSLELLIQKPKQSIPDLFLELYRFSARGKIRPEEPHGILDVYV